MEHISISKVLHPYRSPQLLSGKGAFKLLCNCEHYMGMTVFGKGSFCCKDLHTIS